MSYLVAGESCNEKSRQPLLRIPIRQKDVICRTVSVELSIKLHGAAECCVEDRALVSQFAVFVDREALQLEMQNASSAGAATCFRFQGINLDGIRALHRVVVSDLSARRNT